MRKTEGSLIATSCIKNFIQMIAVLIVDDLSSIREFLKINLSGEPDIKIVGLANNGERAIAQVEEYRPDVVLMDINMPGGIDGIQATKKIARNFPQTKVLLLTSQDDREQLNLALQVGSRGYILKNTSIKDLADIIRLTEKGFVQIGPILGNWNGSLYHNLQSNNSWQIASSLGKTGAGVQQNATSGDRFADSDMNLVLSNLTSEIFELQETIKAQEDTIINSIARYSQVQQEIRTKLRRDRGIYHNFRSAGYNCRSTPETRSQRQQQNWLLISSFFLGVFMMLVLLLLIMSLIPNV